MKSIDTTSFEDLQEKHCITMSISGFHDDFRNRIRFTAPTEKRLWIMAQLGLIHSEVSEALEDIRVLPNEMLEPEISNLPENFKHELADIILRVMDLGFLLDVNLVKAMHEKIEENKKRIKKHGKEI